MRCPFAAISVDASNIRAADHYLKEISLITVMERCESGCNPSNLPLSDNVKSV